MVKFEAEYYILGQAFKSDKFILYPGGKELGFVYAEDIEDMYNYLKIISSFYLKIMVVNQLLEDLKP